MVKDSDLHIKSDPFSLDSFSEQKHETVGGFFFHHISLLPSHYQTAPLASDETVQFAIMGCF